MLITYQFCKHDNFPRVNVKLMKTFCYVCIYYRIYKIFLTCIYFILYNKYIIIYRLWFKKTRGNWENLCEQASKQQLLSRIHNSQICNGQQKV